MTTELGAVASDECTKEREVAINPNQSTGEVDLNTATEGQLLHVEGLGLDRVRVLMRSRPFDNFNELRYLEGFSETLIKQLQKGGATLSKGHLAGS